MNRQSLPVRPEIFERLAVVQLNIRGHGFLNCIRHNGLLRKKAHVFKGQSPLPVVLVRALNCLGKAPKARDKGRLHEPQRCRHKANPDRAALPGASGSPHRFQDRVVSQTKWFRTYRRREQPGSVAAFPFPTKQFSEADETGLKPRSAPIVGDQTMESIMFATILNAIYREFTRTSLSGAKIAGG
jgi:hypothetical protein